MKQALAGLLVLIVLTVAGPAAEAAIFDAFDPVNSVDPDTLTVLDRFSWDGANHFVFVFNGADFTAFGVNLNGNGEPVPDFAIDSRGFSYFWAQFLSDGTTDMYGSNNGLGWVYIGNFR